MAEFKTLRSPQGDLVRVTEDDYARARAAGYVDADPADVQREAAALVGEGAAPGVAPEDYSVGAAAAQKTLSAFTFGAVGTSPYARAVGQRFTEEHPGAALAAEVAGQLPAAIAVGAATGGVGAAVAGAGRAARFGAAALDFGAQAAVGGAQTEAEAVRLSGEEFSVGNAALYGVMGEVFGRGVGSAIGAGGSVIARARRKAIAQEASDAVSTPGPLQKMRDAANADEYLDELSTLAADDLDAVEAGLAEVGRLDRKRSRVAGLVQTPSPAVQRTIRQEAVAGLQTLRAAVDREATPGPAAAMVRQLDERITALSRGAPSGAKLWRRLDENRQALQEYIGDLHTAFENAPGTAWLSREALGAIENAERSTREALLRADAWGEAAVDAQRAYNVPYHEQYFPTDRTVRRGLMLQTGADVRGAPTYRGDPGRIRSLFGRADTGPDARRLEEQFATWLDGVEGVARASERDTPAAARKTLEAVRRLRRAQGHARYLAEQSARLRRQGEVFDVVAGGVGGALLGGPGGALGGIAARGLGRGLSLSHWLGRAARLAGFGGRTDSMAALLSRDALPQAYGPDVPIRFLDDGPGGPMGPLGPGNVPPPHGPAGPAPTGPEADLARMGRSSGAGRMGFQHFGSARRESALADTELAPVSADATPIDNLGPEPTARTEPPVAQGAPTRPHREREQTRGQLETLYLDDLRSQTAARSRDNARAAALADGEFRAIIQQLEATGDDAAVDLAEKLEAAAPKLRKDGLLAKPGAKPTPEPTSAAEAAGLMVADPDVPLAEEGLFGRVLTAEEWRALAPVDALAPLGRPEVASVRSIDNGDALRWVIKGPSGVRAEYTNWEGVVEPGGLHPEPNYILTRTLERVGDDLVAHHDLFTIRPDLQSQGVGRAVLKAQIEQYRKLGVARIELVAIDVGRWFWPSLGFNSSDANVDAAVRAFQTWLQAPNSRVLDRPNAIPTFTAAEAAEMTKGVRSLPTLASTKYGREFLLSTSGPWNSDLSLPLTDDAPMWHFARQRLDVQFAALAALGGWAALEDDGTSAPAVSALALINGSASRLIGRVAKDLFVRAAPMAARVGGRVAYSQADATQRRKQFQEWKQNPGPQVVDRMAAMGGTMGANDFAAFSGAASATLAFLDAKLPRPAASPVARRGAEPAPDAAAVSKFARYEQAALEPGQALQEAAADGYLSDELLETLGTLYPDLLASLRVAAYEAMQSATESPSIQARIQYAKLFGDGALADPSMSREALAAYSAAYAQQPAPQSQGVNLTNSAAEAAAPPRPWNPN